MANFTCPYLDPPVSVHVLQVLVAGKKYDPAGQSAQEVASVVIVHVPEAHFGPTSPPDMVENLFSSCPSFFSSSFFSSFFRAHPL